METTIFYKDKEQIHYSNKFFGSTKIHFSFTKAFRLQCEICYLNLMTPNLLLLLCIPLFSMIYAICNSSNITFCMTL